VVPYAGGFPGGAARCSGAACGARLMNPSSAPKPPLDREPLAPDDDAPLFEEEPPPPLPLLEVVLPPPLLLPPSLLGAAEPVAGAPLLGREPACAQARFPLSTKAAPTIDVAKSFLVIRVSRQPPLKQLSCHLPRSGFLRSSSFYACCASRAVLLCGRLRPYSRTAPPGSTGSGSTGYQVLGSRFAAGSVNQPRTRRTRNRERVEPEPVEPGGAVVRPGPAAGRPFDRLREYPHR
jgi:hypothetical protein